MISPSNADKSLMSDEEYKERKSDALKELDQIEDQISKTGTRVEEWLDKIEEKFDFARKAREKFNNSETIVEEKRELFFRISLDLKLFNKNIDAFLKNFKKGNKRRTNN